MNYNALAFCFRCIDIRKGRMDTVNRAVMMFHGQNLLASVYVMYALIIAGFEFYDNRDI